MTIDRVYTRERGFRFSNQVDSPFCTRCLTNSIENQTHRYASCVLVPDAWNCLRELLESVDEDIIYETDHSLLHLYYSESINGNSILWLIAEYIDLVEREVVISNRKLSASHLLNHLRARKFACARLAMPDIGFIPGLHNND